MSGPECKQELSTKITPHIDGTSGSASIADLWAGKFEALLNAKNPEGRKRLLGQICILL